MDWINDCHVHLMGKEKPAEILRGMDKNKVEKCIVFAPIGPNDTLQETMEADDFAAKIQKAAPKRFYGFVRINPALPEACTEIERGIRKLKLRGVKMLPKKWYPHGPEARKSYQLINTLKVPMLFHSGILWMKGAMSTYCRPAYYEALYDYPNIKFALAHISWPWTDECIAVAHRFWSGDFNRVQCIIDTTSGAPRIWKVDALKKALSLLPPDCIMFGSDFWPWHKDYRTYIDSDFSIYGELGVSKPYLQKIFSANFDNFFKTPKQARKGV